MARNTAEANIRYSRTSPRGLPNGFRCTGEPYLDPRARSTAVIDACLTLAERAVKRGACWRLEESMEEAFDLSQFGQETLPLVVSPKKATTREAFIEALRA